MRDMREWGRMEQRYVFLIIFILMAFGVVYAICPEGSTCTVISETTQIIRIDPALKAMVTMWKNEREQKIIQETPWGLF